MLKIINYPMNGLVTISGEKYSFLHEDLVNKIIRFKLNDKSIVVLKGNTFGML